MSKKSSSSDSIFKTVKIGKQEWQAENLNVDKFRNGDLITEVKSQKEWEKAGKSGKPAWCFYENNSAFGAKYGRIYNWYAVKDPRGLAPDGWHIPTDKEWSKLVKHFFSEDEAGISLKSQEGWDTVENGEVNEEDSDCSLTSGNGSNSSGFSGLPGGCRYEDGQFCDIGEIGNWWSSSQYDDNLPWSVNLRAFFNNIEMTWANNNGYGYSVRCIRD